MFLQLITIIFVNVLFKNDIILLLLSTHTDIIIILVEKNKKLMFKGQSRPVDIIASQPDNGSVIFFSSSFSSAILIIRLRRD